MKNYNLIWLFGLFVLGACNKKEEYNLKGRLFYDCNRVPMADTKLELTDKGSGSLGTTSTNAQGEFVFSGEYREKSSSEGLTIRHHHEFGGSPLAEGLPRNKTDIEVFNERYSWLDVNLSALSQYTNQDTLFFGIKGPAFQEHRVIGPFTSGKIDSVKFLTDTRYNSLKEFTFFWGLGTQSFIEAGQSGSDGIPPINQIKFTSPGMCVDVEVTINLP